MNERIAQIVKEMENLREELKKEIKKEEEKLHYRMKDGRVFFDEEVVSKHKEELISLVEYVKKAKLLYVLTAPFIYMMIIPALVLDVFVTIYHEINFRVYKIPLVKRSDYIVFDRQYLSYLNVLEKINCLYCSYFNGLIAYVAEIAARTEQFWCPIKHAKKIAYMHTHYVNFLPYGDGERYHERLLKLREKLRKEG